MNNRSFRYFLVLLITLLAMGLPLGRVAADTGPKPTIEFTFEQDFDGKPVTIVSGILLQCHEPDCGDAQPLAEDMGPQHFTCEALTCSGMAYGFTDYGQLEITFSDGKVRESNVFAITNFGSFYNVTILEDDLVIKERINPMANLFMVLLCLCCCVMVMLVAIIIVGVIVVTRQRKAAA